ncbi:MAG: DNA polymerase I [Eubacteriales bacterium]|nr:DNA polymerase I [Eubacteriales bacterium]MDD3881606.1 DNA polymerase I [Eubacteriales bacterium]MDD4512335.1 DNA polymerase I [Eubacteriales bacterium]
MRDTFLIVDGNSLLHRAFHALPLLSSGGVYTNAVHGFFAMLFKAMSQLKPEICAVCFDTHAKTFRHIEYGEYKAGRKPTPDELRGQFPIVEEILTEMRLGVLSLDGFEADDLLGTLSRMGEEAGYAPVLLTGDRDSLQLVGGVARIMLTKKGITESLLLDAEGVKDNFGVTPEQITDLKGLMGDSSDNIPGVPGVGEKTAVKLLEEYKTLENTLENAGSIKGKLGERLREFSEQAVFSKKLATIRRDAPIEFKPIEMTVSHMLLGRAALQKYRLGALEKQLLSLGAPARNESETESAAPEMPDDNLLPSPKSAEELAGAFRSLRGEYAAIAFSEASASVYTSEGDYLSIPLSADLLSQGLEPSAFLSALSALSGKKLIAHDGKRLLHTLSANGCGEIEIYRDVMLMAYLINPQLKSYRIEALCQTDKAPDARDIYFLYLSENEKIKSNGMETLLSEIEMPLMRVLYDMEEIGVGIDSEVLSRLGAEYEVRIANLRREVYELTGVSGFNLNSPKQLGEVLFEKMGLKGGKKTKSGYSTDAEALEKLAPVCPAIEPLLSYRQYTKLSGTYIDGLRRVTQNGRVHSTFDQTATATGRISSNEPNLQNIPVRTDLGREIRRAIIPAEGMYLVDADYSQIELRVLAHLSGDENMRDAFLKGQDVHTRTAAEVYQVPMDEVTHQMRSSAKAVNFGLVYGISEFGLARNIGVSRAEAGDFIKRYFERYPGVKRYMANAVSEGEQKGYAETLYHRRRFLPELTEGKGATRAFGERIAMNTPVQGTAADIIKLAMVKVCAALSAEKMKSRLVLQVHDELILECPPEETEKATDLLKREMENVAQLSVPLVAEVSFGKSWYETK